MWWFPASAFGDQGRLKDSQLARELCTGDNSALTRFLREFTDDLYFLAAKFNNRGVPREGWVYQTGSGKRIRVTDDVADTVLWLVDLARVKSCHFRGDGGASFRTYILAVLNSGYTFKDWLKWKSGISGYVPRNIQHLGEPFPALLRLLSRGRTEEQVAVKLGLGTKEVRELRARLEEELTAHGQQGLLQRVQLLSWESLTETGREPSVGKNSGDHLEAVQVRNFLSELVPLLPQAQRRFLLLYWRAGLKPAEIHRQLTKGPFAAYGRELALTNPEQVYGLVDKVCRRAMEIASRDFPEEVRRWGITARRLRRLLKIFLENRLGDK
jgi:hypothetical protein